MIQTLCRLPDTLYWKQDYKNIKIMSCVHFTYNKACYFLDKF